MSETAADSGVPHPSGFVIRRYVPDPSRKRPGRPRQSEAERKARLYLPPPLQAEAERPRVFERRLQEWRKTPIPSATSNAEVARWMWQEGQQDCVLCERPIDIKATAKQHPGRIELDHVVQRTWGGRHEWGNVRPVHRGCNQFRGGGDGTARDFLPQQYRRAFAHALDYYEAPDKPRAKARRVWIRWIEQHHRAVEWWELDLAEAGTDEERDRIEQAIAWNRGEMERRQDELDQLDRDYAAWDARRRAATETTS